MSAYTLMPPADQAQCQDPPYDWWASPDGTVAAEFYRQKDGFFIRFPGQADFEIDAGSLVVSCRPVPDLPTGVADSLNYNAIVPLLANYQGGLNLHGSGVTSSDMAIGFVGHSRSGKTTLAGAFARAGNPLMTEDVLVLEREDAQFIVAPTRPVLRLFPDSAAFLFGTEVPGGVNDAKAEMHTDHTLPFAERPSPLAALFLLGSGTPSATAITPIAPAVALAKLIQHAFVLDVEDKQRLRAHFARLSDLAGAIPCFQLDYPRSYSHLPQVIEAVKCAVADSGAPLGTG